jgi:hypothetical protein
MNIDDGLSAFASWLGDDEMGVSPLFTPKRQRERIDEQEIIPVACKTRNDSHDSDIYLGTRFVRQKKW